MNAPAILVVSLGLAQTVTMLTAVCVTWVTKAFGVSVSSNSMGRACEGHVPPLRVANAANAQTNAALPAAMQSILASAWQAGQAKTATTPNLAAEAVNTLSYDLSIFFSQQNAIFGLGKNQVSLN